MSQVRNTSEGLELKMKFEEYIVSQEHGSV